MPSRYRLATRGDRVVEVEDPLTPDEIRARKQDRRTLTPYKYGQAHRITFRPVWITYEGRRYPIQLNYCGNPFCAWYGMDQGSLQSGRGDRERYRMGGTEDEPLTADEKLQIDDDKYLEQVLSNIEYPSTVPLTGGKGKKAKSTEEATDDDSAGDRKKHYRCNDEQLANGHVFKGETFTPASNWSLADEIARLATHDTVVLDEGNYDFHKEKDEITRLVLFLYSDNENPEKSLNYTPSLGKVRPIIQTEVSQCK